MSDAPGSPPGGARLVSVRYEGPVAVVTLDAPPVNALGWSLRKALAATLAGLKADPGVGAIVLSGSGRGFCAGGDLREAGTDAVFWPPGIALHLLPLVEQGTPVVAAIHGFAVGGGLELALACHARVAHSGAQVGLPEVRRSLIALSGTQRLPRALPLARALRRLVDGDVGEAIRYGEGELFECVESPSLAEERAIAIATGWCLDAARVPRPLSAQEVWCHDRAAADAQIRAERRRWRREQGAPEVDRLAALATLHALHAALHARDFTEGLTVAERLHGALQARHARRRGALAGAHSAPSAQRACAAALDSRRSQDDNE